MDIHIDFCFLFCLLESPLCGRDVMNESLYLPVKISLSDSPVEYVAIMPLLLKGGGSVFTVYGGTITRFSAFV